MKREIEEIRLEDRYQFQPWPVKLYRWLRYTPPACVYAAWAYLTYPKREMMKKEVSRMLWSELHFIEARSGMQHYYTMEEVLGKRKQ